MTKQQKKMLNEVSADRKQRYKMYKSGGIWTFASMFLVLGVLWSGPAVKVKADTTAKTAVAKRYTAGLDSQPASASGSDGTANGTDNQTTDPATTPAAAPATDAPAPTDVSTNATTNIGTNTAAKSDNNEATTTPTPAAQSPVAPAPATEPADTTASQPTTASTSNQITTANLNGTNPANLNADGSISTADKTNVSLSGASDIQDNFKAEQIVKDATGKITASDITDTIKDGGVTLVPKNQSNTAGTLVFKNQIDTSQPFTINAKFTTENESADGSSSDGGGLGFILQPVDPQDAGVGPGSDPSTDIGIDGQPNTTFIGRDGYKSPEQQYGDTQWNQMTVRQTDSTGQLTKDTPTWTSAANSALGLGWIGQHVSQTEYGTLTWTPKTGVINHSVSGTLTYTTFVDEQRTQQIQTFTAGGDSSNWLGNLIFGTKPLVTLNQSVSIAAFGAVGDVSGDGSNERTVTIENVAGKSAFTAKVNTMPVQINYLDQDGNTLQTSDITNVNVGDTLSIGPVTDLSTDTFAPRVINGYQFVKAVTSEGTNSLSVTNNVLNASTQNNQINNINVYYTNQVNYTIQPVDAQGQSIAGLAPQQMTSTIGQQVATPVQAGYTATSASIIAPDSDGSVVNVIYTANKGTLTVTYDGLPTPPAAVSVVGTVGSSYNIETPTIAGYTANLASVQGTYVDGETTLTVHYTASDNSYQVTPVDSTGKVISTLPQSTGTSKTGTSINVPTYAGYTLATDQTIPTTQAGVRSYQLRYVANSYQVTVSYTGLPDDLAQSTSTVTGTTGEEYQISSPVIAGYTADQSLITGIFGPDDAANGNFTVHYAADTKDYKIQPVDANGNPITTLTPQQFDGNTGAPIVYPTYDGYTLQESGGTIPAVSDTMPTINVKYTANPSTVTVNFAGLPTELPAITQTGVTDDTYQINAPFIAGYTPDNSILTGTYSNQGHLDQTITYTANDNSYTITPVDENGDVINGLGQTSGTAKTDEVITPPDYTKEGYQLVPGQPILVTKPGGNNYQVEYVSNIETITVNYNLPKGQTLQAHVETGKIGDAYNIVSPTITGYTPDIPVVTGTYVNQDQTFNVTYSPITVTVTIQHTGLDSATASAFPAQTISGQYGDQFKVDAANIPGYTPDLATISGVFSADNDANMYVITYTGKPAMVTINYTGANATLLQSVNLTGVVGGTYTQASPDLDGFTADQAVIQGVFTADNATDSTTNTPITVGYHRNSSLTEYRLVPVDVNGNPITGVIGIDTIDSFATPGTTIDAPDYSSLGYVTSQEPIVISTEATVDAVQTVPITYQKQVTYTLQAVDANNQPIANLPITTATGIVGPTKTPPTVAGYNAVNNTYTVLDTATTNDNPIQIQYTPKDVAVTVIPVDGNGNPITDLAPITVNQAGGTQLDESTLPQPGYQVDDHNAVTIPISDTGVTVAMTYLKKVTLGLNGSDSQIYSNSAQSIDPSEYDVTLPDGSRYPLKASDVELIGADLAVTKTVQNVGTYQVRLTETGKAAIANALSQNNVVSFDDTQTGKFIITPETLNTAPANTALVPVNATDPSQNPQLATAIVIQGSTKTYDNNPATDATSFKVLAPSKFADFTIPKLEVTDFNTSAIRQDAGNYEVTLSASGLQKLQAANTNYFFDASNVQNGLFVITPVPITITAPSVTTEYTGEPVSVPQGAVTTDSGAFTATPSYTISVDGDAQNVGIYATTVQLTAGANTNYQITTVAGNIVVTPNTKATVTVNGGSKVYDGTTNVDTSKFIVNLSGGLVAPTWTVDDFNLREITSANVGDYPVTLSAKGLSDLQAENPNYTFAPNNVVAGNFTITKAPATIKVLNKTQTYSDQAITAADIPFTITGVVNGEILNYSLSGLEANTKNVGDHVIAVNVVAGDNPNYDVTTQSGTLTVTQASLPAGSVRVNGGTKVYDGKATSDFSQYGVALSGELKAPTWTAADFSLPTNITDATDVGTYTISLSGKGVSDLQAANLNYSVTPKDVTAGIFIITPAPITVTAPTLSKSYDGQTYTGEDYRPIVDGVPANGERPSFTLPDVSGDTNVGTYTLDATAVQNTENYEVKYIAGSLKITPNTTTTVNVTGVSKVYDGLGTTYSVELPTGVKAPASWTADDFKVPKDAVNAGSHTVTLSDKGITDLQAVNSNYKFTSANVKAGSFTITKAALTATVHNVTKVYDGQGFSPDLASLVTVTGLPKNGVTVNLSVNDLSQDTHVGSYDVILTATDNPNYDIQMTNGTLTITPKPIVNAISISHAEKTYDNDATHVPVFTLIGPTDAADYPSLTLPVLAANDFDTIAAKSQDVGSYAVTLTASGRQKLKSANANYDITAESIQPGTLTITPQAVTIAGPTLSKTYDGQPYTGADLKATVTGVPALATSDKAPVYQMADMSNITDAGDYVIAVIADNTVGANRNYAMTLTNGALTINKAAVTISAPQGLTKVYDGSGYTVSNNAGTVTGQPVNGDQVKYHLSSLTDAVDAGTYTLNVIADDNPNYAVSVVPSTFTVTKNDQATVTLGTASKVYDNDPATTPIFTVALPAGVSAPKWMADDFELSSNSQNVGSYAVQLSTKGLQDLNAANANYSFTATNITAGSFNITPATLNAGSVVVQDQSKTYDGTATTDPTQYTVSLSQQLTAPTWTADDFDLSGITSQNVGSYEVKLSAKGLVDLQAANPNYKLTSADVTSGHLVITPATITVTAPTISKVYDGQAYTGNVSLTLTGVPTAGEQPSFTMTDISDAKNAGTYRLTALNGQNLDNYTVNVIDGALTITPAPIQITAPTLKKEYDGSPYAGSVTPVIAGLPSQGVAPVYSMTALGDDTNAGIYTIAVNTPADENPNYAISTTAGQLTITPMTPQFRFVVDAIYQSLGQQSGTITTDTGVKINQPKWTPDDFVRVDMGNGTYTVTLSEQGLKALQDANPNLAISSADITPSQPLPIETPATNTTPTDLPTIEVNQPALEPVAYRIEVTSITNNAKTFNQEFNKTKELAGSAPELVVSGQQGSNPSQQVVKRPGKTDTKPSLQDGNQTTNRSNHQRKVSVTIRRTDRGTKRNAVTQSTQNVKDKNQSSAQNELPQTSESQSSWLAALGAMLMSLLGALGFKKRRTRR